MKEKKRKYFFNRKIDSFLSAILYLIVLSITTFHHHPIDLFGIKENITETSTQKSGHAFTTQECPIINFSKTGFSSLSIEDPSEEFFFSTSINQKLVSSDFNLKNFISYFSRRGPPSYMIV